MSCYRIGCILFNTIFITLHDRMRRMGLVCIHWFCQSWETENDWEALLIYNPDHRNANAIILWRKTQSKKMMHYLNKQNFCVSYMGVGRQNKKWENDVLNRENSTTPLLKGVSTHSSIHDVHKESKSISLHFEKL